MLAARTLKTGSFIVRALNNSAAVPALAKPCTSPTASAVVSRPTAAIVETMPKISDRFRIAIRTMAVFRHPPIASTTSLIPVPSCRRSVISRSGPPDRPHSSIRVATSRKKAPISSRCDAIQSDRRVSIGTSTGATRCATVYPTPSIAKLRPVCARAKSCADRTPSAFCTP